MLRFIRYLFKNGTLTVRTENFDDYHDEILGPLKFHQEKRSKNLYRKLRKKLVKSRYTGALIGNLAYVKQARKNQRQYFFIDSRKLCYIRIFKSASTSVLREILPLMDASIDREILTDLQTDILANSYRRSDIAKHQASYNYFTIVRNPFHRLVSVYLDLFNPKNTFFSYQSYLFGILKADMSFAAFVQALSVIPEHLLSLHFVPQSVIIGQVPQPVKFFRIEYDKHELTNFLNTYSIYIKHQNKNESTYSYRDFYTPELVELVYRRYQQDVEAFGYREAYEELSLYAASNADKSAK